MKRYISWIFESADDIIFQSPPAYDPMGHPRPNSGGMVYFSEPGSSTTKTTFMDPSFTTANREPVILDSDGQSRIYVNGRCDIRVYDENGVWLFSVNNVEMPMPIPSPDQPAQSSRP